MSSESKENQISLSFKSKDEVLKELDKNEIYRCNQSDLNMHLIPYVIPEKKPVQHFIIDFSFNFRYVGAISREFKREFFGANYYYQKDIYIGEWKNDQRHGYGMYIFNYSKIPTDKRKIYFGQYSNGLKEGKGMIIWKHSNSLNSRLIDDSFSAFIGTFKEGKTLSGVYFSQGKNLNESNQIAYIGKFVNDKRTDEEGRIIDLTNSKLSLGNFADNEHTRGYIVQYSMKDNQLMINDVFNFDLKRDEQFYPYDKLSTQEKNYLEKTTRGIVKDFSQKQYWNAIDSYYHKMLLLANECQYLEAYKSLNIESLNFISELKAFEEIYQFE